jgi:hypothetical protein
MSDTTFRPSYAATVPALSALRAGVRRARAVAAQAADTVHTYGLIEGACLFAAAGFAGVMIVRLSGLPV